MLPPHEADAVAHGLQANCYVWLGELGTILVDAVFSDTFPLVLLLRDKGIRITALAITHRHVVGQAEVLPQLAADFAIPVYLHPIDAAHPQARRYHGFTFEDPMRSTILGDAGLTPIHLPGHTEVTSCFTGQKVKVF